MFCDNILINDPNLRIHCCREYVELSRARATLQEAVERRGLPAFTDIPSALRCARAVLRGARTHPRHSLGHTILRLKRAYDAAGGRSARLPRARALDTLKDVARVQRDVADRCLPSADPVDFETFCAAVAELAADAGACRKIMPTVFQFSYSRKIFKRPRPTSKSAKHAAMFL